jgi:MFS family permease
MWAIGSVTGPVIGGVFSQEASWRWIFWVSGTKLCEMHPLEEETNVVHLRHGKINLPFLGIGIPLIILFLKLHFKATSFATKLRRIDWVGLVLFIASTTGFLIPITWGGVM